MKTVWLGQKHAVDKQNQEEEVFKADEIWALTSAVSDHSIRLLAIVIDEANVRCAQFGSLFSVELEPLER